VGFNITLNNLLRSSQVVLNKFFQNNFLFSNHKRFEIWILVDKTINNVDKYSKTDDFLSNICKSILSLKL